MSEKPKTPRLAWLEGLRFISAVGILLYHAQMLFSNYAYSPLPSGVEDNVSRWLSTTSQLAHGNVFVSAFVGWQWFGWVFLGVFMWLTGFGLTLSLRTDTQFDSETLLVFWKKRLFRLLEPFWAVVILSIPALAIVGYVTDSYIPSAWSFGAALLFPVTYEFGGQTIAAISGPWWYVPLAVTFVLSFPWLHSKLRSEGIYRFLVGAFLATVAYRVIAVFIFDGQPTYLIASATAGPAPFKILPAHLFTLALGMASAVWYKESTGPWTWGAMKIFIVGIALFAAGIIATFSKVGWVFTDILLPPAVVLLSGLVIRPLELFPNLSGVMLRLGAVSYTFFLVHNFFVDRLINLWTGGEAWKYWIGLPIMIAGTLLAAWSVDYAVGKMRRFYK